VWVAAEFTTVSSELMYDCERLIKPAWLALMLNSIVGPAMPLVGYMVTYSDRAVEVSEASDPNGRKRWSTKTVRSAMVT